MKPDILLPVEFEGADLSLPARIVQFGYTVKLEVEIAGTVVSLEPDEERNWRAVLGFDDLIAGKTVKMGLLGKVGWVIEGLTKN
jgi:hypothetical protein